MDATAYGVINRSSCLNGHWTQLCSSCTHHFDRCSQLSVYAMPGVKCSTSVIPTVTKECMCW
jgi:hypothetical protein